MRKVIKRFFPKGLLGRSLLILSTPLLLVQAGLTYIFFERHTETVLRLLAHDIAGDVATVIKVSKNDPSLARDIARKHFRFRLQYDGRTPVGEQSWLLQFLNDAFREHIQEPYQLSIQNDDLVIVVRTTRGSLCIRTTLKRLFSRTTPLVLIFTTFVAFFTLVVAGLFMRSQVRPIRELAIAAHAFGRGIPNYFLRPAGALEVRQATKAFNDMRGRLTRHLSERFEMLACLSHDLRTPLTRLKLQLACMPKSSDVEALSEDVDQMQQMLETFLTYARSQAHEDLQIINLYDFMVILQKEFPLMTFECSASLTLLARPILFKRCFVNLLSNATRFAKKIQISAHEVSEEISFMIDDDGPGIPQKEREAVFRPFYRLDSARNLDQAGLGLGLSIVRDVVLIHGGTIILEDSSLGGLRVIIKLPTERTQ